MIPMMNNDNTFKIDLDLNGDIISQLYNMPSVGLISLVNEQDKRVCVIHSRNVINAIMGIINENKGKLASNEMLGRDLEENKVRLVYNLHIKSKTIANYYIRYLEKVYDSLGYVFYYKNKHVTYGEPYIRAITTPSGKLWGIFVDNKRFDFVPICVVYKLHECKDIFKNFSNLSVHFNKELIELYEKYNEKI